MAAQLGFEFQRGVGCGVLLGVSGGLLQVGGFGQQAFDGDFSPFSAIFLQFFNALPNVFI